MSKLTSHNIIANGSEQKPISIDVTYIASDKLKPLVVFVYGFKGFKDWGHFNLIANYFAQHDFVFAKFNFSHNGTTLANPCDFDDLEAFGNNNYIFELNDLDTVLNTVLSNDNLKTEIDVNSLFIIGHSRGGAISIIKTAEDNRIKKIVTWAAVANIVTSNSPKTVNTWKEEGVVHTYNGRTKQNMPLYLQFYQTILANKERLDVISCAKKISIPFFIIHGTNDEAVKETDAHDLHKACKHSQLAIIQNANHTFGGKHPWTNETLPEDAKLIVDKTILFFKK